jgi:hypothetical protein
MDDQCQFHHDTKHTMRECEQLSMLLGYHLLPRRPEATATMTAMVVNASTIVTVNLIDEITTTTNPILTMTIEIDVIIAATIAATTTVVTTAPTGATEVIVVTITTVIVAMTDAMIDVARTTTTAKTTTVKSGHLRTPQRGQPQWCILEV